MHVYRLLSIWVEYVGDVQKEEYVLQDLYINEIERKPCENCERVVQLCHDRVIAPYFFKSCFCWSNGGRYIVQYGVQHFVMAIDTCL